MLRRRFILTSKSELPNGYTRCEYLESTGTQWINTLIKPIVSADVKPTISIKLALADINVQQRIFGASVEGLSYFQLFNNTNWDGFGIQVFNNSNYTNFQKDTKEHDYVFDFDKKKAYQDVLEKTLNFNYGYLDIPLYLFARNTNGTVNSFFSGKIYSFAYIDGTQDINLVPAIDPSGIPCMYDTVTMKPLYNQGTGEFAYKLCLNTRR